VEVGGPEEWCLRLLVAQSASNVVERFGGLVWVKGAGIGVQLPIELARDGGGGVVVDLLQGADHMGDPASWNADVRWMDSSASSVARRPPVRAGRGDRPMTHAQVLWSGRDSAGAPSPTVNSLVRVVDGGTDSKHAIVSIACLL
jgi:hypothetical protein